MNVDTEIGIGVDIETGIDIDRRTNKDIHADVGVEGIETNEGIEHRCRYKDIGFSKIEDSIPGLGKLEQFNMKVISCQMPWAADVRLIAMELWIRETW